MSLEHRHGGIAKSRLTIVSILALAMLAGCAKQPANIRGATPDQPRPPALGAASRTGAAELSPDQEEFLLTAEEELIGRCMRRHGLRYIVVPRRKDDPIPSRPYGSDDVTRARRYGYGIRELRRLVAGRPENPQDRYMRSLPPALAQPYMEALIGAEASRVSVALPNGHVFSQPGGGCVAETRKALYGDLRDMLRVQYMVLTIDQEVYQRVTSDRQFIAAVDAWRGCMRRRGYEFDDPGAARDAAAGPEVARAVDASGLDARERSIAVADADCSRQTGLFTTATRLDQHYHVDVLKEREGEVLAYRERRAAALERARRLLGVR
jgi:hypothetical protein